MTLVRLFCILAIFGGITAAGSTGVASWLWWSVFGLLVFLITVSGGSSGGGSGSDYIFIGGDDTCEEGCCGCNDH